MTTLSPPPIRNPQLTPCVVRSAEKGSLMSRRANRPGSARLSEAAIESKMLEATEVVGDYLASQSQFDQANAAVGALRVSAVALLDATDAGTTARVLREMAQAFGVRTHQQLH